MDTQLLLLINQDAANSLFDALMPALSLQGYLLVLPFLLYLLIEATRKRDDRGKRHLAAALFAILIACGSVYASGFVEDWMKDAVARVRPCRALENIRLILPCPKSYSLPSGHAISSFAFAAPLVYLSRNYMSFLWRMYPLLLASLIAFSRIYLGVHYPSDALAGALLGTGIGILLSMLYQMINQIKP